MSYFNLLKSVSTVIMLDKLKESTTSGPECVRAEVFIPVSQWSVLFLLPVYPVEPAKPAKYNPPAMRVRGVSYTKKITFPV